ncbi:probable LRR receptor-like serine/threonine-protein kinase At3g47570 isoform X1 [Trifolium pratense]|uniref:probable LRR receptor-like serine/threonine-protein kinase At3g47570 isoform X1 n=1 Tax=Trifolium pratense TaxID=57577 RepID=UPI001E6907B7|nr:probable LRR receptor-like serine/threonine-protein kinase At3g47570 isoform X1 [Trifolium pratense]
MRTYIMFLLYFATLSTTVALALSLSSVTDKHALLSLKVKLTNGEPDYLPSWNESLHFCEWEGVTCGRRHMRVFVLQLENQNLGGTLEPALGNLTFLKKLKLSNINLHGEIPREVGRLKRLQVLDLSKNKFHGKIPIELSNCTNIKEIILLYNQLTGHIPSWFGSMMQLNKLLLGANNLVGTIPPSLGNISSLQNITVARNQLEGSIPRVLGKLSNLKELNLGSNNFSGEIPYSLYNLSNIQVFVLGENQFFGYLPSNIHVAFPSLRAFLVGGNHFVGTFPCSISNLTKLRWFDISWNGFNGLIPPTLGSLSKLHRFHIGNNNFGNGGAPDLDFLYSLTNCTVLQELMLDDNRFGGVLQERIGNFSNHLTWLSMASNQISGRIPEGIGQLIGLTGFNMKKNFLEGTIPYSIGMLKNIVILVLQENNLFGNIPIVIGNLTVLSELYLHTNELEGSIPFTLRYCTKLQSFGASDNNLSGNIPNQTFAYLKDLINLDLSNNSLTGLIPSDFGNLKQLSILYLYANKLSGEIPDALAACLTLTELVLQRNFFHGSIPSFLGSSLRSLQILDLSSNNFSSIIPRELKDLTSLSILNLSFNNLYGEVPVGGIFNNITTISLVGNKDLCGGIPQLKLTACSRSPSKRHKGSFKVIFIIIIGGVLISFIVFITICYLRKKTRKLLSSPSLQNSHLGISYRELHEATNGFSSSNLIGTGNFGSVYKGSLIQFEGPIAVKVLKLETHGASKSFLAECKVLEKVKHQNLLKLLTFCSSVDYNGEVFKAIVYEFMPMGSLEYVMHNDKQLELRNPNINFTQSVSVALDVAHALDYLHNSFEQVVVHCDIKPSNVLLDDEMVAYLGDFGLARFLHDATMISSNDHGSSYAVKGTIGYVPPEYGLGGQLSPQGDVFSYGILLLEMLTGKRPTDCMFGEGLSLHEFCKKAIPDKITEIVDSRLLVPYVGEQTEVIEGNYRKSLVSFAKIGVACSVEFSAQRMNIKDAITELHAIKQNLAL